MKSGSFSLTFPTSTYLLTHGILKILVIFWELRALSELYSRYLNYDLTFLGLESSRVYESFGVLDCIGDALRFDPDVPSDEKRQLIRNYCWIHGIYPFHYYQSHYEDSEIYLRKPAKNANLTDSFEHYLAIARLEGEEAHLYKMAFWHFSLVLFVQVIFQIISPRAKSFFHMDGNLSVTSYLNLMLALFITYFAEIIMSGRTLHWSGENNHSNKSQYLSNDTDLFRELSNRKPFADYVKMKDDLPTNVEFVLIEYLPKIVTCIFLHMAHRYFRYIISSFSETQFMD